MRSYTSITLFINLHIYRLVGQIHHSLLNSLTLSDGIVLLNFCVITAPPLLLTTDGVVTMAAFTVEPAAPMAPTAETEPVLEQQDDDEPDEHTDTSV